MLTINFDLVNVVMKMEKEIIKENFEYFISNIVPNIIVLHTKNGAIIIRTIKENFMHLIGVQHSPLFQNKPKAKIFNKKVKNDEYNLFSVISEDNYKNNSLTIEEYNICNKNYYFQRIFDYVLNQKVNLWVYAKRAGSRESSFDCDYLHFAFEDGLGLYLGITGDDESDYHVFSSIIVEKDNPLKYLLGTRIRITKVEVISKDVFNEQDYKFVPSKRRKQ